MLLQLGQHIQCGGWDGTIAAVGYVGERYYWLTLRDGSVAMVPAVDLEKQRPRTTKIVLASVERQP